MRNTFTAHRLLLVTLVVVVTTSSCRRVDLAGGISDSAFVAVMSELKRVQNRPAMDSAWRATNRDSILKKWGFTPVQLEAAARQLAQNPSRAQTVWTAIERRAADTTQAK